MRTRNRPLICMALTALLTLVASHGSGQETSGAPLPSATQYKYATPMPLGVASPDKVETRLGTLNFFDGFPDEASVEKLYDNLDFQRAVQAYLLAIPAVSQAANRNAIRELGPINTVVPIFEQLMDSRSIFLTANDNTVYSWAWIDLTKGPLVLEVPPKVSGRDQRHVVSAGSSMSVSPARTRAAAASTCSCRPATRARCPERLPPSCTRRRSTSGSPGAASSSKATRSRGSTW